MPKQRWRGVRERRKPTQLLKDPFIEYVATLKVALKRIEWIQLLDLTDVRTVQSKDLLGIIADYLIGHRFTTGPNCLDGITFFTNPNPINYGWWDATSQYPISVLPEFSVVIHLAIPFKSEPTTADWSVSVNLSYMTAAIHLYTDYDIITSYAGPQGVGCLERRKTDLPANTVVKLQYDSITHSVQFTIGEKVSNSIKLPQDWDASQWFPSVTIRPCHEISLFNSVSLLN